MRRGQIDFGRLAEEARHPRLAAELLILHEAMRSAMADCLVAVESVDAAFQALPPTVRTLIGSLVIEVKIVDDGAPGASVAIAYEARGAATGTIYAVGDGDVAHLTCAMERLKLRLLGVI